MNINEIPQITPSALYEISIGWNRLEAYLDYLRSDYDLDLSPDYQRSHVWTPSQESRYVEWILRGGHSGKDLFFNAAHWNTGHPTKIELVDGKQRLKAVLSFLSGELKAFDKYVHEFEGDLRKTQHRFNIKINDIKDRKDVMQWYLDLNSGGTVHSKDELDKVIKLIKEEDHE